MVSFSDVSKSISAIAEIAKRIKNYELTEQVSDLRGLLMDLLDENTQLRSELEKAQLNSDFAHKAVFKDGMYWLKGDSTPFCQRCWEIDHNIVHLGPAGYGTYYCPEELYQRKIHRK